MSLATGVATAPVPRSDLDATQIVPMDHWGRDHWSTLLYVDTVMVDCGGFQVGMDPRMKSNRRHLRVMGQCPAPKRAKPTRAMGVPMRPEHASLDNAGRLIDNHDDWCCLQDFAAAGLLTASHEAVQPGASLHFSQAGRDLVAELRAFKADGGQLAAFRLPMPA